MNKATLIQKVLVVGVCTAIGFGGVMASGEATPTAQAASVSTTGTKIVSLGKQYMGTPYKFGVTTKTTRYFDCSSFTKYIYGKYGVTLPRTSVKQSKVGRAVSKANLRVGDLVFFSSGSRANGSNVTHVAVYAGGGKILHTYGSPGVTISDLNSGNWKRTYLKARRVL
ncbi:NlpC/P60 family protein [Paenibacillus sophorae]|uniref:C40 family peptidase n=1 Tax=Paenibacillus sophorae TaxID=1333845 RepID=A0A1H8FYW6_9BACL|nr:C40 family peptidase [Paenibacillus sophorae]QWU14023.1 C40 family peptidase [Paenibacillus sophorae]SEN36705.1 NlpC/P60 family protein [Paenibacillus sophorae]